MITSAVERLGILLTLCIHLLHTQTCISVDNVDLSFFQGLRVLLLSGIHQRNSTVNLLKSRAQQFDKAHCLCAFRRGKWGPCICVHVCLCLSAESRFCYQQLSVQHEATGQLKEQWITIPQSRKHNWVSNIYILCLAMERGFIKSSCVRLSRISNLLLIWKPKLWMEPLSRHMQETSVKCNYLAVISQLNAFLWNSSLNSLHLPWIQKHSCQSGNWAENANRNISQCCSAIVINISHKYIWCTI